MNSRPKPGREFLFVSAGLDRVKGNAESADKLQLTLIFFWSPAHAMVFLCGLGVLCER
jgi:hypothetical protein